MQLNANKCKLLNVSRKLTTSMYDQEIKPSEPQKDLGLIITSNLSWQDNGNHSAKSD